MSELIQKLLAIGGCDANTEWAKGYDDGVNNAINVVEEYFKQPQLDPNQQIVLDYLKYRFNIQSDFRKKSIAYPIYELFPVDEDSWDDYVINAFNALTLKQEAEVLQIFIQWALEQEEE